jgi:hypothetical protein
MSTDNVIPNEVENEARGMGWVPQDEWKGSEDKWTSAEEFVEKGKNIIPLLRKRVEQLDSDLKMATNHNQKELDAVRQLAEETAYAKATAEYQAKLEKLEAKELEAFQSGDSEEFLKVKQAKEKLEAPEKKVTTVHADTPQGPSPEFIEWSEKNKWYSEDKESEDLVIYANAYGAKLANANPNLSEKDLYKAVEKQVKTMFPHKFENPRRSESGSVEGDSGKGSAGRGKTFNDLPAAAKATYKRLAARFQEKGREYKKEDYATEYFAQ